MYRVEDIDRNRTGDRLGERDIRTQRVSEIGTEVEIEKEVSAMLKDYDVCGSDQEDERSPPKLELVSGYRQPHHSPPSISNPQPTPSSSHPPIAIDTSNVRFRPVSLMAQAEMTSTYGHPRLNWPEKARVNNCMTHTTICMTYCMTHATIYMAYCMPQATICMTYCMTHATFYIFVVCVMQNNLYTEHVYDGLSWFKPPANCCMQTMAVLAPTKYDQSLSINEIQPHCTIYMTT